MLPTLPAELMAMVFSYFRSHELARLATVCRAMNAQVTGEFIRTFQRYFPGEDTRHISGYAGFREAVGIQRVMVQSTWSFMERMQQLEQLLEMFEQQIDSMFPMPTPFVPANMLEDAHAIQWTSQSRWVFQEAIGSHPHFGAAKALGAASQQSGQIVALVDCAVMVQCLLALIRQLRSGQYLYAFDLQTRR